MPVGLVLILLACFGVDSLIGLSSVSFPASVACLILLFLGLIVIDLIIGDRKTRALVSVIDVPVSSLFRGRETRTYNILRLDLLFAFLMCSSLLRKSRLQVKEPNLIDV